MANLETMPPLPPIPPPINAAHVYALHDEWMHYVGVQSIFAIYIEHLSIVQSQHNKTMHNMKAYHLWYQNKCK